MSHEISHPSERQTYADPTIESDAREVRDLAKMLRATPTYDNLRILARAFQRLGVELHRELHRTNEPYKNGARHFATLTDQVLDAALSVKEVITRTNGGDRSAHALIVRTREDVKLLIEQKNANNI